MNRPARLLAACSFAALPLLAAPTAEATSASISTVREINRYRADVGLRPLRPSPSLSRSAHRYSALLMRRDWLGHLDTIRASGRFRRLGEVLALGRGRGARIRRTVRRWMLSPYHRSVLLNPSFSWAGAGRTRGRFGRSRATIWVVQVGRR